MNLILGQARKSKEPWVESHIGMACQTYRGLVRQIRRVSRVAMSIIPVEGKRSFIPVSRRYRYLRIRWIGVLLEALQTHWRPARGASIVTMRTSA